MRWIKWMIGGALLLLGWAASPLVAQAGEWIAVHDQGETVSMYREAYLIGVVAAEMPASYEPEALKAQAVAARTRVERGHCLSHPEANVCTDSGCCQGYLDEAAQKARWGDDMAYYHTRIRKAVEATDGVVLMYEGELIEVLYHAVSGGYTEDVENVYETALPYLRSVVSPGEEQASRYETIQVFTQNELAAVFPDAAQDGMVALTILERSQSGRVTKIQVGPYEITGRVFRSALGLKSTNFEIHQTEESVTFYQRGYGHGVGMSQAGANAMALAGAAYDEILYYYYTGVELCELSN